MPIRHHLKVLLYDVKTDLVANNNIYTMLRHVEIDGEHIERATGPATMLLNCGTDGILYSNGNGVLNNVTINTTQGTLISKASAICWHT